MLQRTRLRRFVSFSDPPRKGSQVLVPLPPLEPGNAHPLCSMFLSKTLRSGVEAPKLVCSLGCGPSCLDEKGRLYVGDVALAEGAAAFLCPKAPGCLTNHSGRGMQAMATVLPLCRIWTRVRRVDGAAACA